MKKSPLKIQDFKLPLIQSKSNIINKSSKINSKRSRFLPLESINDDREKQKKILKSSNLKKQYDRNLKNKSKPSNLKLNTQKKTESSSQTQSDFQQKIQENKILLKKKKLQKQVEKRAKSISKTYDKQNMSTIEKMPLRSSKAKNQQKKRSKKKLISFLANTDSKDWIGTIMKGTQLNRSRSSNHLQKTLIQNKSCDSNVFDNIHSFLKSVQPDLLGKQNVLSKQALNKKLLQYCSKLQKIEPNSQFLKRLSPKKYNSQSLAQTKLSNEANRLHFYTASEWKKITINDTDSIIQVNSSFNEQIEKVGRYLNRTSMCLDELLQHKKSILDLLLLKKIKTKQAQQNKAKKQSIR